MKILKSALVAILWIATLLSIYSCKKEQINTNENAKEVVSAAMGKFTGPLVVSLYAGVENQEYGFTDGPRLLAKFASPYGITSTPTGALYITDGANLSTVGHYSNIRKISPEGLVSTLVFKQLNSPGAITSTSDGSVYFLEYGSKPNNQKIRRITLDDQIQPRLEFCRIGINGARIPYVFISIYDFAVASDGTIYLIDGNANTIIKRATNSITTEFAGQTLRTGYKDGKGADATFNRPTNIAIDDDGNLYVTDFYNFRIRKITPDGTVSTIAGSTKGFADGIGSNAKFTSLQDIAVADSNTLVVADGFAVRSIDLTTHQVTTIAGSQTFGNVNGPALSARFGAISQIAVHNNDIYISEQYFRYIRKISPL
ncbi:hypothetical protein [Mucilaginibacter aquariorum]|uniref:NHL repeat-containing protein n=1 Tax=Mucilaginibacter aquariorum TaxID=2967225 RepID=A0ABT1T5J7_9SPHI|nr:hypothetical protein [Mucilaginibacter aquariorum]MCQ6959213.1 hypothetical protein [Mucilaginibacter aquariorum]